MRRVSSLPTLAGALAVLSCAPPSDAPRDPDALPLLGTLPITPLEKVSFTLTDTRGQAYDFRKETDGHITLLFFGYTFCPDICPVHMATLTMALRELPTEIAESVRVVFVSVDPDRDTPERLGAWLAAFDSSFIGVSGTEEEVARALAFYRYPPPEKSGDEPGYTVGHPALIYAFTPDDRGRAMYGPDTRKTTWVHDLRLMAGHEWRSGSAPGDSLVADPAPGPGITIADVVIPRPATATTSTLYATLRNGGTEADTLLSVETPAAASASLHEMLLEGGMMRMSPVQGGLPVPPGGTVRLEPGSFHGMLEGLDPGLKAGSTAPVTFHFAKAGAVTVEAQVLRYEDLPGRD